MCGVLENFPKAFECFREQCEKRFIEVRRRSCFAIRGSGCAKEKQNTSPAYFEWSVLVYISEKHSSSILLYTPNSTARETLTARDLSARAHHIL